jgi:hypothetical protein
LGEKHKLPLIGTSDNHILKYLDHTYTLVESDKNVPSIFKAIKNNKISFVSHDLSLWQMIAVYLEMGIRLLIKKITLT